MGNINIRVLTEDDWQLYKSLRLGSLEESPDSFGSTHECEAAYSDREWKSRLDRTERARLALPLIAEVNGSPAGLAWGLIHDYDSKTAYVYQMWVAPECRGMGIGRALLGRIMSWAEESRLNSVALTVTTTNDVAVALYESSGFTPYGEPEELRPGSDLCAQPMVLELRANAV